MNIFISLKLFLDSSARQNYSKFMDILVLKSYYENKGADSGETENAMAALRSFQEYMNHRGGSLESCSVGEMKSWIKELTDRGEDKPATLLALTRASYLAGNRKVYIYFTQIVERPEIIGNIKKHMESVLGDKVAESIFAGLPIPAPGAPPEEAWKWTGELIRNMEKTLTDEECRMALTANAHGMKPEHFAKETGYFHNSPDLENWLEESHRRAVATLQEHADTGKVWFEQIITPQVVEFVKADREILGGVLEGNKIYWTKIPYDTPAFLAEKDTAKKRYYACHCPMAREVLLTTNSSIPRKWCNCTSGFVAQRFSAIFGETVQVDLLESVLGGDNRCRFAIHVPERFR